MATPSIAYASDLAPPPAILPIPAGVPDAVEQPDGSWLLPPELADEIELRLIHYRRYPEACAAAISAQDEIGRANADAAGKVATARCRAEAVKMRATEPDGWRWWEVGLLAGGVGAGCLLVGLIAGFAAAQ